MKTLLLLYLRPASHRHAIVARNRERLRERGIRLVSADDEVDVRDAEFFHDAITLPPQEEVGRVVDVLLEYARRNRIDGVVAQTEAAILPGALFARALSVPGIPVEAAHACVNKLRSRMLLQQAGVPVPAFGLAGTAAHVRAFADACGGFPVVLKAVASSMSRLVTLVRTSDEVPAAIGRMREGITSFPDLARLEEFARVAGVDLLCDPRERFLVEAFAKGDPIETDGVVVGDTIHTFGVTEQAMLPPPRFYIEGYLFPSDRPPDARAAIERISSAALTASGVRDTGFSIEMRASGDDVRVIEVNGRLGQDDGFAELFKPATGLEPLVHLVDIAAGLEPVVPRASFRPRAIAYRCSFVDGVVRSAPGDMEIQRLAEQGFEAGISVAPGTRLYAPPHPEAYPHLAWAIASDATSSREAYARADAAVCSLSFEITE